MNTRANDRKRNTCNHNTNGVIRAQMVLLNEDLYETLKTRNLMSRHLLVSPIKTVNV